MTTEAREALLRRTARAREQIVRGMVGAPLDEHEAVIRAANHEAAIRAEYDDETLVHPPDVWAELERQLRDAEAKLAALREAARDIADGGYIDTDAETGDEWCHWCEAFGPKVKHKSDCTFVALRAALDATEAERAISFHHRDCPAPKGGECICTPAQHPTDPEKYVPAVLRAATETDTIKDYDYETEGLGGT